MLSNDIELTTEINIEFCHLLHTNFHSELQKNTKRNMKCLRRGVEEEMFDEGNGLFVHLAQALLLNTIETSLATTNVRD